MIGSEISCVYSSCFPYQKDDIAVNIWHRPLLGIIIFQVVLLLLYMQQVHCLPQGHPVLLAPRRKRKWKMVW